MALIENIMVYKLQARREIKHSPTLRTGRVQFPSVSSLHCFSTPKVMLLRPILPQGRNSVYLHITDIGYAWSSLSDMCSKLQAF
ncbi:hypothetical protein B0I35DRAFT_431867 [Stachybotrys elegans]|uniref:Uncharacterized protein n=1 Tax=Stachybotrys elegans TaxID=80388 RepID=A0A8K0WQP2_9HYPO|nr:hypothetical protein B0I35DRAFT_431867 [Stachybotrys elegans]